jgi:hypothetical protein
MLPGHLQVEKQKRFRSLHKVTGSDDSNSHQLAVGCVDGGREKTNALQRGGTPITAHFGRPRFESIGTLSNLESVKSSWKSFEPVQVEQQRQLKIEIESDQSRKRPKGGGVGCNHFG